MKFTNVVMSGTHVNPATGMVQELAKCSEMQRQYIKR